MGLFEVFNSKNTRIENTDTSTTESSKVLDIQFTGFSKSNRNVAMKLTALNNGVSLISDTIASLPIYKYKLEEDGSKIKSKEKINYLINRNCNEYCSAFDMKQILISSALLEGNGFILVVRNNKFEIEKLVPLKYSEVQLRKINGTGDWMYYISKEGYIGSYQYYEVINLSLHTDDGVSGKGILEIGKETIGLGNALNNFMGATISNGSFMKGLLTTPSNITPEQREDLSQKIKRFFSGGNSGRVLVLPEDLKYQNISLSPSDVELLQHMQFNISDIARLLKISPHMIGGEEKSGNYNSLEQSNLNFLTYTLLPYLRRVEELFNQMLLTEEEKESGEYFFEFSIDNLLRTDKASEIEYYSKAIDAGVMSINEVRTKLNLSKEEGLDIFTLPAFNSIVKDGKIVNTVMNETIERN